ncbi:hypothetical protein WR25_26380 [Diploscapter pachys]|uniref:Guanylate cyclase domain-containing protein n=1 Tax=Diploscapter pachys TaxID=2018661 RepID=A0A2A2JI33_9BILA|nr:hypothetical protein WR25_26380 [Diploscapter pachys]
MLPRQVAERLKLGQAVEPESFDNVTVFFSDIVKFTQLAMKSTPFEVVSLLNDLYSRFDTLIEEHNVYKVESIGDGYLCVSGLPDRNGTQHVKEIADLSLGFMDCVKQFKIPHLSREKIELRIGINSGACVAGVVGLSMPRYCLFGDTVNTATSHIHMSSAAHSLLIREFSGQYETQSRGDVIIKGKGVMETFWLLSRVRQDERESRSPLESALQRPSKAPLAEPEESPDLNETDLEKDKPMKEISLSREKENQQDNNLTVPLYRQFRQDALSNL